MSTIKVALRVRPLSSREAAGGFPVVVGVDDNSAFITDIRVPERPSADSRQRFRQFDFDHAFWLTENGSYGASQSEVYEEMGPSLEHSILEGYNACLLAYGESGTGKTHTMLGTKEDPGLIPRLCQGLWDKFSSQADGDSTFRMEVSFMEIYREKVRDLLTPVGKHLKLREHPQFGPHVQDLSRVEVSEQLSLLDLLWEGERRRATGTTGSNRRSSRSHAIWTLYLTSSRNGLITTNQVHLVDLAGSEKADLTTTKNLLAEGKDINRSLVSLGNVISSLAERSQHIPYRDSALTWLLKDSLGGNATTAIIITSSPASCCHAQTLNSFRFAQRARLVENQPQINYVKAGSSGRQSGLFSGMSTFDLRKDISRLASIIRTAQSNGGILRGLMPRYGWNRLISAIENWNHYDSEEGAKQPSSVETATTSSVSVTDVMIQADLSKEDPPRPATEPPKSVPSSPGRVAGTEVFIPLSSSLKCLTWKQDEVSRVPKAPSLESEDEVFLSPPSSPHVHHLKYLIPIHFPTAHRLGPEARIAEKIHGNYLCKNLQASLRLDPVEVTNNCQSSPVVRDRVPSLVHPSPCPLLSSASEVRPFSPKVVSVRCRSLENSRADTDYSFNIPEASEWAQAGTILRVPMESTDEEEEAGVGTDFSGFPLQPKFGTKFRTVYPEAVDRMESSQEDALFFSESMASSSSYESLQASNLNSALTTKVKVVQNSSFDFEEVEDRAYELMTTLPVEVMRIERTEAPAQGKGQEVPVFDGTGRSKFRTHFSRELTQMDRIGKEIQSLKKLTERYSRVKPYLDQIAELELQDHSKPDPKLDAQIEECSGWNANIEYQKVQDEIAAINKLLKQGSVGVKGSASESSARESDSYSLESSRRSSKDSGQRSNGGELSFHRARTSTPNINYAYPKPSSMPIRGSKVWNEPQSPSAAEVGGQSVPRCRIMLPKTHQYLCRSTSAAHHLYNLPVPHDFISCPSIHPGRNLSRQQSQAPFGRPPVLRSVSSENSSCHEDYGYSYHEHVPPSPCLHQQASFDLCSCQESDTSDRRWSESTGSEILSGSYDYCHSVEDPSHQRFRQRRSLVTVTNKGPVGLGERKGVFRTA